MVLTNDFRYEIKNGFIRKIDTINGTIWYWSERWKQYLKEYQFCSEHFYCNRCLRDDELLKEGFTRYDSLVLCEEHNSEFLPTVKKLNAIFENNPNVTIVR